MALKTTITRNENGDYEVWVVEENPGYMHKPRASAVTWTLRGARRKAKKLIAQVEREDEFARFREEIVP